MLKLNDFKVILGSMSARRKRILEENLGLHDFIVVGSNFAEDLRHEDFASPSDYCLETAYQKALSLVKPDSICQFVTDDEPWILICADSIFVHGSVIIEKPRSIEEACIWLKSSFRGSTLEAISGVVLVRGRGTQVLGMTKGVENSLCHLWDYPLELVDEYLAKHADLALGVSGAVALSGPGAFMISGYTGCFFNAAGLPVKKFYELLLALSS
jgi:predicted house-cleaning NTP pyrophosphatase (Maf/HAM1 superfamily)